MEEPRSGKTSWIEDEMTVLIGAASTLRRYWYRFSEQERREWTYVLSERTDRLDHLVKRIASRMFSSN